VSETTAPPRPLVVTLPLPDKRLLPNNDAPERTRKDLRRQLRKAAGLATRVATGKFPGEEPHFPAGVRVVARALVRWDRPGRFPDVDNCIASMKGNQDGLADGFAIADDKQIVRWELAFERVEARRGEVVLTLVAEV
jgi:hypothetical protein